MDNNNQSNQKFTDYEPNTFAGPRNRMNSNRQLNNEPNQIDNNFTTQYNNHRRQDSDSEATSPTYRTNTYSSSPNSTKQKTFHNGDEFAYSTSTLNNTYQLEQPHLKPQRVKSQDYYELSSYNNRKSLENTDEKFYNPNVYGSDRIVLPPHVTVSATGGTTQEISYYPQRDSYLIEEYNNSYNQNSYASHFEEDLIHPNSRAHLDPNSTTYVRPANPYLASSAPIYNPGTLISTSTPKKNWWRYPYFTFFITLVQVCVFAYQLYSNYSYTGNPIATKPLNIMIGPSTSNLIHQGARYVPCMKSGFSNTQVECLNVNDYSMMPRCPVVEVCGFESFSQGQPNQWFRFITPMFLHAGVLHLLFNLFSQLTLGGHLEKYWGPFRIFFIYALSGIGGFIFGGVYSIPTLPSVGASGAIFGLVGCELIDLIQNWKLISSPGCQLFKLLLTVAINFALGLLPFIDNFSHIGGFIVGILASILIIPLPSRCSNKIIILKWIFMAISFGILVYLFYSGATGFYDDSLSKSCPWCKYLNCLPALDICKDINSQIY